MALTYRQIEQILALAQYKSFAKASRHLHLSQPALSRSISNLEDQIGVKIFDRKHNNVSPTLFGRHILERGGPLLKELKLLQRDLQLLKDNQAGEINFGCGPFPAEMFVGEAVAKFHSTYPKIDIDIAVVMTLQLLKSLRDRSLDLFVADTRMILQEDDLEITNLRQRQAYFCCKNNHPLTTKETISLEDIFEYPLATMWLPATVISMLQNMSAHNFSTITDWPCGVIKCDNFSILWNIVSSTNALTISCEDILNKSIYKENLTFIPLILSEFNTHFGIVSLKDCTQPPAIEYLKKCINEAAEK